jgi:hypothetical protein
MKRFRIKDSVPDIYLKESRDFQLLCDLYDLVNSGVKFDIDTITHLSDTSLCRSSMLQFLQEKLGLSLREDVTDETLRTILKCFPFAVRLKGTKRGVAEMVCLFLNILYSDGSYIIEIENINDDANLITSGLGNYVIAIATTVNDNRLKELDILEDLLRYVIPAGYKIDYSMNIESKVFDSTSLSSGTIYITAFDERKLNRVRIMSEDSEEEYETSTLRNNLNSVGAVVVRAAGIDDDKVDDKVKEILDGKSYIERSIPEGRLTDE